LSYKNNKKDQYTHVPYDYSAGDPGGYAPIKGQKPKERNQEENPLESVPVTGAVLRESQ